MREGERVFDRMVDDWADKLDQPSPLVIPPLTPHFTGQVEFLRGCYFPGIIHARSGLFFTIELRDTDDPDAVRCDFYEAASKQSCLLIVNDDGRHDGPHIPITDEAFATAPKGKHYIITSMGRGGDHDPWIEDNDG